MLSEHSGVKPSIPGLAVQELSQGQSIHAQTDRVPVVSHAIRAAGHQYPLPSAYLHTKQASEQYF